MKSRKGLKNLLILKANSGSISIFISLVLSIFIIVNFILIDFARYEYAKATVESDIDLLGKIYTSKVNPHLKRYGIFSIDNDESIENNFRTMLIPDNSSDNLTKMRLLDFKESKLEKSSILNPEIFNKQIIEDVKYKAPISIGESLLKKIDIISDTKILESVESKMKFELELDDMGSQLDKLLLNLKSYQATVFELGKNASVNSLILDFNHSIKGLLKSSLFFGKLAYDKELFLDLKNKGQLKKIKKYDEENLMNKFEEYLNKAKDYQKDLLTILTKAKRSAQLSSKKIETIKERSSELEADRETWKRDLNQIKAGEIKTSLMGDYESQTSGFNAEKIEDLNRKIKEKINDIDKLIFHIDSYRIFGISLSKVKKENIYDYFPQLSLKKSIGEIEVELESFCHKNIKYVDIKNYSSGKLSLEDDPFFKNIKKARIKNYISSDASKRDAKKKRKELVDQAGRGQIRVGFKEKKISDRISSEDLAYINKFINESFEADLEEEKEKFNSGESNKSLNKKSRAILRKNINILNAMGNIKDISLDRLYIMAYANIYFSSRVKSDNVFYDPSMERFFKGAELEYLIWGKDSYNSNLRAVSSLLYAIRLAMNTAYAFTSSDLKLQTLEIATAIAGWTGFGIPIVQSILLFSLAMGESFLDLRDLESGKLVPIFKNSYSWNLSVHGAKKRLSGEIKEFAVDLEEDIFKILEDFSMDKIEELEDGVEKFVENTNRTVIDNISNSIINPIMDGAREILSDPIDHSLAYIEGKLRSSLSGLDKSLQKLIDIKSLAKKIFDLSNLKSSKDVFNKLEESILSYRYKIENAIKEKIFSYGDKLKSEVKKHIKETKDSVKKKVEREINLYLEKIKLFKNKNQNAGNNKIEKTSKLESSGGINIAYDDYINLFILKNLISEGGKKKILARMIHLIKANLSDDFNLKNSYTAIKISGKIETSSTFLSNEFKAFNKTYSFEKVYGY